jgi:hypothetical protein
MTVYVVDDLTRVRPQDPPQSSSTAILKAARNEYAAFQIVVRAPEGGLAGGSASASALRSEAGDVIPAANVALFREHYVEVVTPSPKSKEGPGWYPDALIPFPTAPFELEGLRNQPLWADVYVPRDAAPGVYSGEVTVTASNEPPVRVPVELTVWDFALPETPSLRSSFGDLGCGVAAQGIDANSLEFRTLQRQYAEALAAHRICPAVPSWLKPRVNRDGTVDAAETDVALTEWMERFHVTGFPLSFQGSDPVGRDRERNVAYFRSIYAYLTSKSWNEYAYVYALDEPNTAEAYEEARQRAKLIHEAQPGIQVLVTEQPTPRDPAWGTLVGSVDLWVPLWPLFDEAAASERLAAGEEMWSYTALCQGAKGHDTPFWQLDFPLMHYRVPAWISWRYGLTGLLYWTGTYWDKTPDVWRNPLTYNDAYNYEGSLFYPANELGAPGFVASMRVKQIRQGMQDYEYIKLLAGTGGKDAADAAVLAVARSWTDWSPDAAGLYAARERIAQAIVEATSTGKTGTASGYRLPKDAGRIRRSRTPRPL